MPVCRSALYSLCVLAACQAADGPSVEPFALADHLGAEHRLADWKDAPAVVVAFVGAECPLVQRYMPRLKAVAAEYRGRGVRVVAIDSNQQDSLREIGGFVRKHGLPFPLLKDPANRVADAFDAERTPEVFVLDGQRRVRYRGAIDDQHLVGASRPDVGRQYLRDALDAVLAGKDVPTARTRAVGCYIGRIRTPDAGAAVTYHDQIARLLQRRCTSCHQQGQIAPFALTEYDEVVGWADMIQEVADDGRMPPWHADPAHGAFVNDQHLTDDEKSLIRQWVAAGAPEGDRAVHPGQPVTPPAWSLTDPDLVVEMPETFAVPAEGVLEYKYFAVDTGFTEDKWVTAAECRPGAREVVHHIIAFIQPPGGKDELGHGERRSQWLAATAPGAPPMRLPAGMAKRVPAGSRIVFQMHYTPDGTPHEDRSSVALKFADEADVTHEVATREVANHRIRIPAGAAGHVETAGRRLGSEVLLLSLFPHMHQRGAGFRYVAEYPDGTEEILLDIPRYDFNWQNTYQLAEPKTLPAGTTVRCTAVYDNSTGNPTNPDPTKTVRWGDQTWEEMMIGYFNVALPKLAPASRPRSEAFRADPPTARALTALADRLPAGDASAGKPWRTFGEGLASLLPQLDRIDVTVLDGQRLRIARLIQRPEVAEAAGKEGQDFPAASFALAGYARTGDTVRHAKLAGVAGLDMRALRAEFASSLHVPVSLAGKPATVNFWSAEADAFPAASVPLFESLAQAIGSRLDGK